VTDNDIQLLALGAAFGMYAMLLLQIVFGVLDGRRDRKALRAHEAKLEAAQNRADA